MPNRTPLLYAAPIFLLALIGLADAFSAQLTWTAGDYVVAALLLYGLAFALAQTWQRLPRSPWRVGLIALIVLAFLMVWAELAVGIFGTPLAGD